MSKSGPARKKTLSHVLRAVFLAWRARPIRAVTGTPLLGLVPKGEGHWARPPHEPSQPTDIAVMAYDKTLAPQDWDFLLAQGEGARLIHAGIAGGRPALQLAWGQMLLSGHGVGQNQTEALRWFERAAQAGDLEALNMVGRCFEMGWGTARDAAQAAVCYRQAAEADHLWASFNLGMLCYEGEGAPVDHTEALHWFLRAGRRGHAKAMTMLGRYCEEAWAGRRRPAQAFHWYRRAAKAGDFQGQFHYGRLLFGYGAREAGLIWLQRGVDAGIPAFCVRVARDLGNHPDPDLRQIAAKALARAA